MQPWVSTVMGKYSHFLLREQNLAVTTAAPRGLVQWLGMGRPEKPGVPSLRGEGRSLPTGSSPR